MNDLHDRLLELKAFNKLSQPNRKDLLKYLDQEAEDIECERAPQALDRAGFKNHFGTRICEHICASLDELNDCKMQGSICAPR